jgi:hypothetical protein
MSERTLSELKEHAYRLEGVAVKQQDEIAALRAEVERLNGYAAYWEAIARKGETREEALEAEIDAVARRAQIHFEAMQVERDDLRSQLSARDAEVRALRDERDLLVINYANDGVLAQNERDRAWQALRDFLNGTPEQWAEREADAYADGENDGYDRAMHDVENA